MKYSYNDLILFAKKYEIPIEDILLIYLNRCGLKMENTIEKRIRFRLKLNSYNEVFYMAVCVDTYDSPFELKNNIILFNGKKVADVINIEKDTCDTTYFRRNKTELTLNSNARSQCRGCKFCGTYKQEPDDIYQLDTVEKLSNYTEILLKENNMRDLSDIVRVTVCTGCFPEEEKLVEHLKMIRNTLKRYNFNKKIRYIGSQIRSKETLEKIQNEVAPFSLSLTTECFSNRQKLMRNEKASLDIKTSIELLDRAKQLGFAANCLYILGLDELSVFEENMRKLAPHFNRFPVVQIMQNYIAEHEKYRTSDASNGIEYYLKARKILENIFKEYEYKPRCWENYRGLFYTKYNGIKNDTIKI